MITLVQSDQKKTSLAGQGRSSTELFSQFLSWAAAETNFVQGS